MKVMTIDIRTRAVQTHNTLNMNIRVFFRLGIELETSKKHTSRVDAKV